MTDPRMLLASLAAAPSTGRHTGAEREEIFSKPAATFSNPAATKSKPGTTKSKLDATKSKWLFLPRFEPFQRLTQMFTAFLPSSVLRRVVDPAFGPRPADGHSHSTDSVFSKENAAQEFFRKVRASRTKTAGMGAAGFWFRIKSSARVFSERRKFPANQNGRRDV